MLRDGSSRRVVVITAGICGGIATLASVRWIVALVTNRDRGLDVSDEAYYLLSAREPGAAIARQGDFAFYTNLLWRWSGSSIGGFRVAGLLALLGACVVATLGASRWLPSPWQRRLAVLFGFPVLSATALTHYSLWLVTPGYNLLTLVASLLAAGGLLAGLADSERQPEPGRRPAVGFVVLGVGLVLVTESKFPAGAATAMLVAAVLPAVLGWRRSLWAAGPIGAGVLVGVVIHLAVVGSPVSTLRGVHRYLEMSALAATYPASKVWETDFLRRSVLPWSVLFVAVVLVVSGGWRWIRRPQVRVLLCSAALLVAAAASWTGRARGGDGLVGAWWWVRMTGWTLLFTTACAPSPDRRLVIGPAIAAGAIAVGFGSNNGFIHQSGLSVGLYGLAVIVQGVLVVSACGTRPALELRRVMPAAMFVAIAGVVSYGQVAQAVATPYRLGGHLAASSEPVSLPGFGYVRVTPDLARYLRELETISQSVEAAARACLVDLSGGTPVAAIGLDARPAAIPWMYGGSSGAAVALEYLLDAAPCVSGPVLLIDAPAGGLAIPRPRQLVGREEAVVGTVHYRGYLDQVQTISVLGPAGPRDE